MTDDLARVVLTREQLPAPLATFVVWTRALPRLLGFTALTGLDTGLSARGTGSLGDRDMNVWTLYRLLFIITYIMTSFLTRVNSTGQPS